MIEGCRTVAEQMPDSPATVARLSGKFRPPLAVLREDV
jgi:hypothetical protein